MVGGFQPDTLQIVEDQIIGLDKLRYIYLITAFNYNIEFNVFV